MNYFHLPSRWKWGKQWAVTKRTLQGKARSNRGVCKNSNLYEKTCMSAKTRTFQQETWYTYQQELQLQCKNLWLRDKGGEWMQMGQARKLSQSHNKSSLRKCEYACWLATGCPLRRGLQPVAHSYGQCILLCAVGTGSRNFDVGKKSRKRVIESWF
jgi:hypothetical protein